MSSKQSDFKATTKSSNINSSINSNSNSNCKQQSNRGKLDTRYAHINYDSITQFDNDSKSIINSSNKPNTDQIDSILYCKDLSRNDKCFDIPNGQLAYPKETERDYSCISYISSNRKPDIYVGDDVIKAKFYKIIPNTTTTSTINSSTNPKEANTQAQSSDSSDEDDELTRMRKQAPRYFLTANISIKCYNCDEVGHMSRNCPNARRLFCNKCSKYGHLEENCPNMKCFKCNRIGHRSFECTLRGKDIKKCENCKNIGHTPEDCLIEPMRIKKSQLKDIECSFCGKFGHFICDLKKDMFIVEGYDSEKVEISESESDICIQNESDICSESESESGNESPKGFGEIIKRFKQKQIESKNKDINNNNNSTATTNKLLNKKRKRIFPKLDNKLIKDTVFCPKCAEMHDIKECNVSLRMNEFDRKRQYYSKTFFNEQKK